MLRNVNPAHVRERAGSEATRMVRKDRNPPRHKIMQMPA
jgi:hypothetical protein